MASRAIFFQIPLKNSELKTMHPQYLSGLSRALFPKTPLKIAVYAMLSNYYLLLFFSIAFSCGQDKFLKEPSVFVTAAHHHAGLKRDAASIWLEDITHSSFKICLRELQNYAGSHEDIHVVSNISFFTTILKSYFVKTI